MRPKKWPLVMFASLGVAKLAIAQTPMTVQPGDGRGAECELHIWPSAGLESLTEGWLLNHTRNQALHNDALESTDLAEAMGPQQQLNALAALDLPGVFHLGGAQIILHSDPQPTSPGTPPRRHTSSASPCYTELVIRRLVYAKNPLAGGALQGFFLIREFGAGDTPSRSFTSMADTPLTIFPWKKPQDTEGGRSELEKALRADVVTFAGYFTNPSRK